MSSHNSNFLHYCLVIGRLRWKICEVLTLEANSDAGKFYHVIKFWNEANRFIEGDMC